MLCPVFRLVLSKCASDQVPPLLSLRLASIIRNQCPNSGLWGSTSYCSLFSPLSLHSSLTGLCAAPNTPRQSLCSPRAFYLECSLTGSPNSLLSHFSQVSSKCQLLKESPLTSLSKIASHLGPAPTSSLPWGIYHSSWLTDMHLIFILCISPLELKLPEVTEFARTVPVI